MNSRTASAKWEKVWGSRFRISVAGRGLRNRPGSESRAVLVKGVFFPRAFRVWGLVGLTSLLKGQVPMIERAYLEVSFKTTLLLIRVLN